MSQPLSGPPPAGVAVRDRRGAVWIRGSHWKWSCRTSRKTLPWNALTSWHGPLTVIDDVQAERGNDSIYGCHVRWALVTDIPGQDRRPVRELRITLFHSEAHALKAAAVLALGDALHGNPAAEHLMATGHWRAVLTIYHAGHGGQQIEVAPCYPADTINPGDTITRDAAAR